ncbi:hypothetical protein EIN_106020 [Entamoeba invadens IP1]|uniref:Leucine rich repeat containing protein BspA family protein n=1 Tax=Entamoeba invadens IP1 TaxID=370355 RepID=A0A0A1U7B7_ENTIV|nr:hypothetical protein EIN_106020 [Entamoeba invadens IP1]ELP90223.1 hypothetical protein EIN_106020 [Entamoeba invadens IP1]|eukprot:XP_004256994.1 hypothetical protein EIN_106020 [Entamoeba invadens IP1]
MVIKLDRYSMMIVSKYFICISNFKNMVLICKKFEEIPQMFHFNPISVSFKTQKCFPNVETLHLYNVNDKFLSKYKQYYVHYTVPLSKYYNLIKGRHVICPFKTYSCKDIYSYSYKDNSFKGDHENIITMDCTNIIKFGLCCFMCNNSLVAITLSCNLREIPDNCFRSCNKLKEINLEHIRVFGEKCFAYCKSLSAITLGTNIIKTAKNAFVCVTSIQNVTAPKVKKVEFDVTASSSKAFLDIKHKITTTQYDINNNILPDFLSDEIDCYSFNNRSGLSDINLATTVTCIADNSFSSCDIERLDLSHVTHFGSQRNMTRLTAITLNSHVTINNLYEFTGLKKIDAINTKKINVKAACWMKEMLDKKSLEVNEFCYTQQDVDYFKGIIPSNYTNLKNILLYINFEKYKVEEIVIPEGITSMSFYSYQTNKNLRKFVFPKTLIYSSVSHIIHSSLEELCIIPSPHLKISNCDKLTSVTFLSQDVTNFRMFDNCFNIKNIEFPDIRSNFVFKGSIDYTIYKALKNKYSFEGDVVLYSIDPKWIDINNVLKIPNDVNVIEVYNFGLTNLEEIWMGDNVKSISLYYCRENTNLKRVRNIKRSVEIRKYDNFILKHDVLIDYID